MFVVHGKRCRQSGAWWKKDKTYGCNKFQLKFSKFSRISIPSKSFPLISNYFDSLEATKAKPTLFENNRHQKLLLQAGTKKSKSCLLAFRGKEQAPSTWNTKITNLNHILNQFCVLQLRWSEKAFVEIIKKQFCFPCGKSQWKRK